MATKEKAASRYRRNRDSILSNRRAFYAANREIKKEENKQRWLRKRPEERKFLQRRRQVKHMYHLTAEAHDAILEKQNYKCPITGWPVDLYSAVDHDHACCPGEKSCGKCVRGVIAHKANRALGIFEDDPESLLRAYEYLKEL